MTTFNNLIKHNSELYQLGLPLKLCKVLHAAGIFEIKTLRKMCYNDLIKISGMGEIGIAKILVTLTGFPTP